MCLASRKRAKHIAQLLGIDFETAFGILQELRSPVTEPFSIARPSLRQNDAGSFKIRQNCRAGSR